MELSSPWSTVLTPVQLEKAHDKIVRRDETIAALSASKSKRTGTEDRPELERRLHELVQAHEKSKQTVSQPCIGDSVQC